MPIAYLDVPAGADRDKKSRPVKALYGALHEVYPFPDDTRIFLREWPLDSVSQNGLLGSEPARPVFIMHVPQGGDVDAKRKMLKVVNAAVADAYRLPDFANFLHEHTLETVVINGTILADDRQRVEDQSKAYPERETVRTVACSPSQAQLDCCALRAAEQVDGDGTLNADDG